MKQSFYVDAGWHAPSRGSFLSGVLSSLAHFALRKKRIIQELIPLHPKPEKFYSPLLLKYAEKVPESGTAGFEFSFLRKLLQGPDGDRFVLDFVVPFTYYEYKDSSCVELYGKKLCGFLDELDALRNKFKVWKPLYEIYLKKKREIS